MRQWHVLVVVTVGAVVLGSACGSVSTTTDGSAQGQAGSSAGADGRGTAGSDGGGVAGVTGSGAGGSGAAGVSAGVAGSSGAAGSAVDAGAAGSAVDAGAAGSAVDPGAAGSAVDAGAAGTTIIDAGSAGAAGAGTAGSGAAGAGTAGAGAAGSGVAGSGAAGSGAAGASAPAPILHYTLDGNGTNTGSVAGYPLTFNGTVAFVAGKVGQAAQYASGAYGVVQGSARAVLGVSPQYTIAFWVYASSPSTVNSFIDFNNRTTAPFGGVQLSYDAATQFEICVSTTSNSFLTGSCPLFAAPANNSWHHVILRYAGTGTGAGQGAGVDVYEDDVLVETVPNDAANDPVFNQGMPDSLNLGIGGTTLDDVRIYNTTFSVANQCLQIIGGTWNGSSCTLP